MMRKTVFLALAITLMFSATAFAAKYRCICTGTQNPQKTCGAGYTGGQYMRKLDVSSKYIKMYLPTSDITTLDSKGLAHSKQSGWVCAKK